MLNFLIKHISKIIIILLVLLSLYLVYDSIGLGVSNFYLKIQLEIQGENIQNLKRLLYETNKDMKKSELIQIINDSFNQKPFIIERDDKMVFQDVVFKEDTLIGFE